MRKEEIIDIICRKAKITQNNKCIVCYLYEHADGQGIIRKSIRDIQKTVKKSLSTIHATVSKLIEANCLEMLRGGVYRLLLKLNDDGAIMPEYDNETIVKLIWKYFRNEKDKKYFKCILESMADKRDQNGLVVHSIREISNSVNMPYTTVHQRFSRMRDEGFIEEINRGVYRLNPEPW